MLFYNWIKMALKQKLFNLFLFLTISVASFAQIANQPSDFIRCDQNGDGFESFSLEVKILKFS